MKKHIIFFTSLVSVLASCKKTDIEAFDGDTSLYFSVFYADPLVQGRSSVQPYSLFSFFAVDNDVDTVRLRVNMTGAVAAYDRKFVAKIDPDSTTAVMGIDFEPLKDSYVIPANQVYADIPVVVKRSEAMKANELVVGVRLMPNENFMLSMPVWYPLAGQVSVINNALFDARYHAIKISDIPVAPSIWISYGRETSGRDAGYWGVFSADKYDLMCEIADLNYEDFTVAKMNVSRAILIATLMKNYLTAQFQLGTPVKEKDGRLMWVNGVSWTSTVGVPYN